MSNVDKYQIVSTKKKEQPEASLSQLCRENGVSYQSYYLWAKKQQDSSVQPTGGKVKVMILISARELANALTEGVKQIPVPIRDIIRQLPNDEQRKVSEELGRRQLEGMLDLERQGL